MIPEEVATAIEMMAAANMSQGGEPHADSSDVNDEDEATKVGCG